MALASRMGWAIDGFFFDGNWLLFAAGVFVYFALAYGTARQRVGLCAALVVSFGASYMAGLAGSAAYVFAAGLVILRPWDAGISAATVLRPIAFCGRMCYSLYLVHQIPVRAVSGALDRLGLRSDLATLVVTVPLCIGVSVALGAAFYWAVERHFLNSPSASRSRAGDLPSAELGTAAPV
jgi:peptidoglycan/LPS O-acetylase OafA/YrhL